MKRAIATACLLVLAACASQTEPETQTVATSPPAAAHGDVVLVSGDVRLAAEVVATPRGRQRGLMFREALEADSGMLFLFPASSSGGFWMKNTLIPLSIAYMAWEGERFDVLEVLDMEPCEADPCRSYDPDQPYEAALEVEQGWFSDHGIGPGDTFELRGGTLPTPR